MQVANAPCISDERLTDDVLACLGKKRLGLGCDGPE